MLYDIAKKYALQNAVRYNGIANTKAVIAKLFSLDKSYRDKADEVIAIAQSAVDEVNQLSLEEQTELLKKIAPELLEEKKEEKKQLMDLHQVNEKVVMRFAPNPNGPLHLGHARTALLNWFYVKRYKGSFILRFDDTDPKNKIPVKEAYKWIEDDLKWLGIKPKLVVTASSRLKIYYNYATKLIDLGKAYVCTCNQEEKRSLLNESKACDCRNLRIKEQQKRWKKTLKNGYKEGKAVLRIKTDLNNKNPAVRDWIAIRIVNKSKHPLSKAKLWPLLNFASAIDDHDFKVTHIIRGIDLKVSDERQKFVYDYLGWRYPYTYYNGKLFIHGIKSTSETTELIESRKIKSWDDPRLATLMALKKRGYIPEAIKNFLFELGLTRNTINVDFNALVAKNKAIVEKTANRYFFVANPKKIFIKNAPKLDVKLQLHPDNKKKGFRSFKTKDKFYIQDKIEKDKIYRLIGLFNFGNKEFVSKELDNYLNATLIHWLPITGNVKAEIVMPDFTIKKGIAESGIKKLKVNDVIQFVRFGFCKLNKKSKGKFVFYYTHG